MGQLQSSGVLAASFESRNRLKASRSQLGYEVKPDPKLELALWPSKAVWGQLGAIELPRNSRGCLRMRF